MTFKDYLGSSEAKSRLNESYKWWTDYIYHFSDIKNIAGILNSGFLRSRNAVLQNPSLNYNDNASAEVIAGTAQDVHDHVRFYFRPLTPTQYINEGIQNSRDVNEYNAHCPIPIFLLFDTSILDNENTFFTYESLASHHDVAIFNNLEDFIDGPLHHIYHTGPLPVNERDLIKKRRHAEIIIRDFCDLNHLKKIVCRTPAERDYLLDMLLPDIKIKFENLISVIEGNRITEMFFCRNLMIREVNFYDSKLSIWFNKSEYTDRHIIVQLKHPGTNHIFAQWDSGECKPLTYLDSAHCLHLMLTDGSLKINGTELFIIIDGQIRYQKILI